MLRGGESYMYSGGKNPWVCLGTMVTVEVVPMMCVQKSNGYGLCDMSGNVRRVGLEPT